MIALANIFSVNIVTWRLVDNGIATVINPVVPEQSPTSTLHLLHNGTHFEDTNILASFLPQRIEQRTSGSERRPPLANSPNVLPLFKIESVTKLYVRYICRILFDETQHCTALCLLVSAKLRSRLFACKLPLSIYFLYQTVQCLHPTPFKFITHIHLLLSALMISVSQQHLFMCRKAQKVNPVSTWFPVPRLHLWLWSVWLAFFHFKTLLFFNS